MSSREPVSERHRLFVALNDVSSAQSFCRRYRELGLGREFPEDSVLARALTVAIAVTYARPFTANRDGDGRTIRGWRGSSKIAESLSTVGRIRHSKTIDARNGAFAHSDAAAWKLSEEVPGVARAESDSHYPLWDHQIDELEENLRQFEAAIRSELASDERSAAEMDVEERGVRPERSECRPRHEKVLQRRREEIREASHFLTSNEQKLGREKWICTAFLRGIGVDFHEAELSGAAEPVDVVFRCARFQMKEMLDPGRRRGDEYRALKERAAVALTEDDLMDDWEDPPLLSRPQVYREIAIQAEEVSKTYGADERSKLDLLLYFNREVFLQGSEVPEPIDYGHFGFRSISAVVSGAAWVLYAATDSPCFIRRRSSPMAPGLERPV